MKKQGHSDGIFDIDKITILFTIREIGPIGLEQTQLARVQP